MVFKSKRVAPLLLPITTDRLSSLSEIIMNSGIYALYWWEQDLVYVGLSRNLHRRRNQHMSSMVKNTHDNYKVQQAFNNFG
jgi:excinuclease UvrABC nuclease subunit